MTSSHSRIVLIEGDARLRQTLAFTLRSAGYAVFSAATGAEGLRMALLERPDLVLTGILLPDRPGTEVARDLKATADWHAPIIALTSCAERDSLQTILSAGCDAYISKPTTRRELLSLIEDVLGEHARPLPRSLVHRTTLYASDIRNRLVGTYSAQAAS